MTQGGTIEYVECLPERGQIPKLLGVAVQLEGCYAYDTELLWGVHRGGGGALILRGEVFFDCE